MTWRDAALDERPEGMAWQPPTEDDPAKLFYDVWKAQRDCLDTVESGDHDVVISFVPADATVPAVRVRLAALLEWFRSLV